VFTATLPNETLVALMLSVGTAAFNCREKPMEAPPALAVRVADCDVLTDDTVAVNPALVDVAGTVNEAGTVTALLLLERLTAAPPLGADPVNVTVHESVPDPVMEELVQYMALTAGVTVVPVPLKLTTAEGLVDELFEIVNCPVTDPAAVGLNCTVRTTAWPGLRVTGNALPETEKPAPVTVPVFKVRGAVPVDDRVTDFVTAVFSATLPNESEVAPTVSVGTAAFNCTANPLETPPAVAVTVAD
jgi:hypothetical protein